MFLLVVMLVLLSRGEEHSPSLEEAEKNKPEVEATCTVLMLLLIRRGEGFVWSFGGYVITFVCRERSLEEEGMGEYPKLSFTSLTNAMMVMTSNLILMVLSFQ